VTDVPTFPSLADLKAWLGLDASDTTDDTVLTDALAAACVAQAAVVAYPYDEAEPPTAVLTADLETALFLRAQRLAARRNSPEGVVGFSDSTGDFVAARVPSGDYDVVRLERPSRG
jgi:hypothetical protein